MLRADEEDDEKDEKSKAPEPQSTPVQNALFKSRTVLIFGEVDMKMAERVTAQLLAYAETEGDIRVIMNSPGGHVESGDTRGRAPPTLRDPGVGDYLPARGCGPARRVTIRAGRCCLDRVRRHRHRLLTRVHRA